MCKSIKIYLLALMFSLCLPLVGFAEDIVYDGTDPSLLDASGDLYPQQGSNGNTVIIHGTDPHTPKNVYGGKGQLKDRPKDGGPGEDGEDGRDDANFNRLIVTSTSLFKESVYGGSGGYGGNGGEGESDGLGGKGGDGKNANSNSVTSRIVVFSALSSVEKAEKAEKAETAEMPAEI